MAKRRARKGVKFLYVFSKVVGVTACVYTAGLNVAFVYMRPDLACEQTEKADHGTLPGALCIVRLCDDDNVRQLVYFVPSVIVHALSLGLLNSVDRVVQGDDSTVEMAE